MHTHYLACKAFLYIFYFSLAGCLIILFLKNGSLLWWVVEFGQVTTLSVYPCFIFIVVFFIFSAVYVINVFFIIWFLSISTVLCFILFAGGLTVLPIIFLSLYAGVCAVLLISSFMLVGGRFSVRFYSNFRFVGIQLVLCGIFIFSAVFAVHTSIEPVFDGAFYEYSSRASQMLLQKFLFFNTDILVFYVLFDCFFWGL